LEIHKQPRNKQINGKPNSFFTPESVQFDNEGPNPLFAGGIKENHGNISEDNLRAEFRFKDFYNNTKQKD
jgi:hypothetical protein